MKTYTVCPACNAINGVALAREGQPKCGACQSPLSPYHAGYSELSSAQLEALLHHSPLPVAVDFWAPWCAPCRAFAPAFQQAAQDLAGKIVFVKVNTEADPAAGQAFRIQAIPTLLAFDKGLEKGRMSGALPLEHYKGWLAQSLG